MGVDGKERIWPTLQNLDKYLLDTPEHKQRYDLACDFILGLECADVSCGAGYGSFMLSNAAKKVIGYDVSKEALIHAKKYFQTDKVQFDHLDEFHSKKFDAIISFETLEHMDEKQGDSFLANICNNLKSEGTLIISTPLNETKYRENVTKFHIREYSNQEFKLKLENAGFTIDKWFGQSNSVSKKMSKKFFGISLTTILNTGVHRLIPKFLRSSASSSFLGKNKNNSDSILLTQGAIKGSFSQIAICRKR